MISFTLYYRHKRFFSSKRQNISSIKSHFYYLSDESDDDTFDTQMERPFQTSKDTFHILKLSAILQILNGFVKSSVKGGDTVDMAQNCITTHSISAAQKLYHAISKQKSIFVQVFFNSLCNKYILYLQYILLYILIYSKYKY